MFAAEFEYHRPKTVAEAVKLLRKVKGSRPLAGGHSLLPAMKLRLASPAALIDISRIDGQVRDSSIKKVGEVVSSHPEEALAIIRTWLHEPA